MSNQVQPIPNNNPQVKPALGDEKVIAANKSVNPADAKTAAAQKNANIKK